MSVTFPFPKGFLWGCATASYQIEGAHDADGRQPSVWDVFSRTPGKTVGGDTGDIACDHYHRYREDVALMKSLGLKAYRFSIAWPRVVPDGDGEVNQKGLDFYRRLVDELLSAGIEPFATCYHWDMPQATYRKHRGWHGRQTAQDFARYAGICAKALGDRVRNWFTINEFSCFTALSYSIGLHAPGEKVERKALNQLTHHALLGHGLAVDAIRANAPGPVAVGLAENCANFVPVMETAEHIEATRQAWSVENGHLLIPVLTGAYDPRWLQRQEGDAPTVTEGELRQISRPLDLVALNIYSGAHVAADAQQGYRIIQPPKDYPTYNVPWLKHLPDCLYWSLRFAHEKGAKRLSISENGCCATDAPGPDGAIDDVDRVLLLREYLRAASRATSDGVPLQGYFLWTLMDNFEWAEGYSKRFGIVHTDFATQRRTPKLSARWYSQVIAANRVL